jgi:hypothetical protein
MELAEEAMTQNISPEAVEKYATDAALYGAEIKDPYYVRLALTLRALSARIQELEKGQERMDTLVRKLGDAALGVSDGLEDEGDRVYLGSTNDKDIIRRMAGEYWDWWLDEERKRGIYGTEDDRAFNAAQKGKSDTPSANCAHSDLLFQPHLSYENGDGEVYVCQGCGEHIVKGKSDE